MPEVGTIATAVTASLLSGFAGAYLGAWITTKHDRTERLRALRIDAADDLVQAWATALFAIDSAIRDREEPRTGSVDQKARALAAKISEAHELVNKAVTLSVRVDLLFASTSPTSTNTNAVRDEARQSLHALEQGEVQQARKWHGQASLSHAYLVVAAGEAISSTGTRRDAARDYGTALAVPEIHPEVRAAARESGRS